MIGKVVAFVVNIFRFHKFKVAIVLVSALFFTVMIFPYDDLSEVVTNKVNELSQNRVFVQFDSLGLQVLPYPALAVQNAVVETGFAPSVQAEKISVIPSLTSLLTLTPGMHATAKGVWGGTVDVDFKMGKKNDQGGAVHAVNLDLDKIDVAKTAESMSLPMQLQGQFSGEARSKIDFDFASPPEGELKLTFSELRFPAFALPLSIPGMGGENAVMTMDIPGLRWTTTQIKGHLANHKLTIDEFNLGSDKDALSASIRGDVGIRLDPQGGAIVPVLGAYNLEIDLSMDSRLEKDFPIGGFLAAYKQAGATPGSTKYRFALSGAGLGSPKLGPIGR